MPNFVFRCFKPFYTRLSWLTLSSMVSKLSFIFKCLKPFYIIKSVDKPNYVIILHRRCSSTVSSESCPPLVESVQFSVVHLVVHRGRPWTGNQCFVHHCYQINFTFHLLPHFLTIPEHFIVILDCY